MRPPDRRGRKGWVRSPCLSNITWAHSGEAGSALPGFRGTQPMNKDSVMRAISVRDRDAGIGGLSLTDMPYPQAAGNDVIVRVHAAGFTPGEHGWPAT